MSVLQRARIAGVALLGWTCCQAVTGAQADAGAADSRAMASEARPTRQQLVGAWTLVAIEYEGPRGESDPFYQAGSTGLIIYDLTGWMSVQIGAPHRRHIAAPAVRVPPADGHDDPPKAEAFDTYYSYYGTWNYDASRSIVTHHVVASIISGEAGLDYSQTVALERGRLVLTVRSGQTVRRKVWEKLTAR